MPKKQTKTGLLAEDVAETSLGAESAGLVKQREAPPKLPATALAVDEAPPSVIEVWQLLMGVHRAYPLLRGGAAKLVVENLGGGDVYISPNPYVYRPEYLLPIGGRRELVGEDMYAYAASRPTIKVTILA